MLSEPKNNQKILLETRELKLRDIEVKLRAIKLNQRDEGLEESNRFNGKWLYLIQIKRIRTFLPKLIYRLTSWG